MDVETSNPDMCVELFQGGYLSLVLVNESETCNVGGTVVVMAVTKDKIENVKECLLASIVSGSATPHGGTTVVYTASCSDLILVFASYLIASG